MNTLSRNSTISEPLNSVVSSRGSNFCGISDAGLQKTENQDALFLSDRNSFPLYAVLCDGISSLPDAAEASRCAVTASASGSAGSLQDACKAAAHAVETLASHTQHLSETPGTTFLAVRVSHGKLSRSFIVDWCWAGDTILCWIPVNGNPVILSPSHSDETGALTKSLGKGADSNPEVSRAVFPGGGWLLLCTDGLWKYDRNILHTASVIRNSHSAEDACRLLTSYAYSFGAADNISMIVMKLASG